MKNYGKPQGEWRSTKSLALTVLCLLLASVFFVPVTMGAGGPPEVWNRTYSQDPFYVSGQDVVVVGNYVYLVGYITSSDYAAFIQKYDTDGNRIWTRLWNVSGNDLFHGVATLGDKIYTVGTTHNASLIYQTNTLLVCYDSNGNQKWNRSWSNDPTYDSAQDSLEDIAIYDSDNLYVTGTSLNSTSAFNVLIMKYNSTGHLSWTRKWGGTSSEYGSGIAVDGANAIYVTGATDSYGPGARDLFLNRYNSSGHLIWSELWGGSGSDRGYDVVTDDIHNIYITGSTSSFGLSSQEACVLKYDATGQKLWNVTLNEGSSSAGNGITIDPQGNLYITGIIEEAPILGAIGDLLIAQYDTSGNKQWSMRWGNTQGNYEEGRGIAVLGSESLYIAGHLEGDGGFLDAVLIKFNIGQSSIWLLFLILLFPLIGLGFALFVIYKRRKEMPS